MSRAGIAALVVAAAGWGSLSVTTTIALRGFGPLTLLVAELAIAVVVLAAACFVTGQRLPRLSAPLIALGLLEPGVAFLAFNYGVQRTSASHAGLLIGTETVFVVVLGMLVLRERPRPLALVGVGLAVAGVATLAWQAGGAGDGNVTVLGDALILADAVAAAYAVVLTVRLVRDVRPLVLTTIQFAIGLALVLPFWTAAWLSGAETLLPAPLSAAPIAALLVTGSLGIAGAFLIYTWALTQVSATTSGAAVTLVPLFALALSTLILAEPLTLAAITSAGLILTGLATYTLAQRPALPAADRPETADRGNRHADNTAMILDHRKARPRGLHSGVSNDGRALRDCLSTLDHGGAA